MLPARSSPPLPHPTLAHFTFNPGHPELHWVRGVGDHRLGFSGLEGVAFTLWGTLALKKREESLARAPCPEPGGRDAAKARTSILGAKCSEKRGWPPAEELTPGGNCPPRGPHCARQLLLAAGESGSRGRFQPRREVWSCRTEASSGGLLPPKAEPGETGGVLRALTAD